MYVVNMPVKQSDNINHTELMYFKKITHTNHELSEN